MKSYNCLEMLLNYTCLWSIFSNFAHSVKNLKEMNICVKNNTIICNYYNYFLKSQEFWIYYFNVKKFGKIFETVMSFIEDLNRNTSEQHEWLTFLLTLRTSVKPNKLHSVNWKEYRPWKLSSVYFCYFSCFFFFFFIHNDLFFSFFREVLKKLLNTRKSLLK